jgi:hypothetical protein
MMMVILANVQPDPKRQRHPSSSMNVYLERVGEIAPWHDQWQRLREFAEQDAVGRHRLVEDREDADIILSVFNTDPRYAPLAWDERRFAYSHDDLAFPVHPGIYPSLPSWNVHPAFTRSGPFLLRPAEPSQLDDEYEPGRYLFSFVGAVWTSPIRRQLMQLGHPRGLVRDSSQDDAYKSRQPQTTYQRFHSSYQTVLAESVFVLCPRGVGASSWRLFETMRAGRAPVVISDAWVPPAGVPWEEFSVRVAEREIGQIAARLTALEDRAHAMGARARQVWDQHFSETRIFDWLIEQIAAMQQARTEMAVNGRFRAWRMRKMVDRRNLRQVTLPWLKRLLLCRTGKVVCP